MKVRGTRSARLALISMVSALATAVFQQPVFAQAESDPPELDARLTQLPSWLGPADSLRIGLEVTNNGAETAGDLRIAVSVYEGVRSRSQLLSRFGGSLGTQLGSDTFPIDGDIGPGQTRKIEIEKPLAELSAFRSQAADRAYPLRIAVRSDGIVSDRIDTQMIFFATAFPELLKVGLIVPLHSPSMYADPSAPQVVTSTAFEKAITTGRVNTLLEGLENSPEVPVTIAPSGLFIDMLSDLADGYQRRIGRSKLTRVPPEDPRSQAAAKTLARIRLLAQRSNTRLIAMPYSAASLPGLVRSGLADRAQAQVVETLNRLGGPPTGVLGGEPLEGWLLPSYGVLDERTLAELQRSTVKRVILASESLREASGVLTRARPVEVETRSGPVLTVVEDSGLRRLLGEAQDVSAIVARQRFLSDTAAIMLERPSVKRAVAAVAPIDWSPRKAELEGILQALASSPWMRGATPDSMVAELPPPENSSIQAAPLETIATQSPDLPTDDYFLALRRARRSIQQFGDLAPPAERLVALQRRLLIAESADWWKSERSLQTGTELAEAIAPNVSRQMSKIRAPGAQTITLTSRTGVIPLSVSSDLSYPVDVVVRLDSDKLRFPNGNRIVIQKLEPPNKTLEVRTIAQATGTFPLRVEVQTPRGVFISSSRLTIRSTAYNVVGLAITAGAGLFLLGWWVLGVVRKRVLAEPGEK